MKRAVTPEPSALCCDYLTQVPIEVVARIVCNTRENFTLIQSAEELRALFALRRVSHYFLRHLYDAYIVPQFRELSFALARVVCDRSILLFPCLEKMSLCIGTRLTGQSVTRLTRLSELHYLQGQGGIRDRDVSGMTQLTCLNVLFSGCPSYPCVARLTKLRMLNIEGPSTCLTKNDGYLCVTGLTSLSVRHRHAIESPRLCDTHLSHLTNLTQLRLWGEDDVSARAISLLTRLVSLELSHVALHDTDLLNTTRLRRLRLPGNKHLTDAGLTRLSALTWLDISGCVSVTDRGLSRLTNLKTLVMRDTECHCRVTEHGLSGLRALSLLNLGTNTNLTADTLRRLPALRMLVAEPYNPVLASLHWKRTGHDNIYRRINDTIDEEKYSAFVY